MPVSHHAATVLDTWSFPLLGSCSALPCSREQHLSLLQGVGERVPDALKRLVNTALADSSLFKARGILDVQGDLQQGLARGRSIWFALSGAQRQSEAAHCVCTHKYSSSVVLTPDWPRSAGLDVR